VAIGGETVKDGGGFYRGRGGGGAEMVRGWERGRFFSSSGTGRGCRPRSGVRLGVGGGGGVFAVGVEYKNPRPGVMGEEEG